MRRDMARLLVERGRSGKKYCGTSGQRRRARQRSDGATEGMRGAYGRAYFAEYLAPLRRFLGTQVGRPWARVYSEIRRTIRPTNVAHFHVLQHLEWEVVTDVLVDGRGVRRLRDGRELYAGTFWVCPATAVLRQQPPKKQPRRGEERRVQSKPGVVVIDAERCVVRLDHGWWRLTTESLSGYALAGWLQETRFAPDRIEAIWAVLGVRVAIHDIRSLSKRELRDLGLRASRRRS